MSSNTSAYMLMYKLVEDNKNLNNEGGNNTLAP
jgi:hypothetical protein